MFVMHERKYLEDIMASNVIPNDLSITRLIGLLGKYYYSSDILETSFIESVQNRMRDFNIDILKYQEYRWVGRIKNMYKRFKAGTQDHLFREIEYIPLYESEVNILLSCCTDRKQRLLGTIYTLARFGNCSGWVSIKYNVLFKLANINLTAKEQLNLLRELKLDGLIGLSKRTLSVRVLDYENAAGEEKIKIYEMDHIGNQVLVGLKDGYRLCDRCHKLIKINKNAKYCSKCKADATKERKILYEKKRINPDVLES